MSKQIAYLSIAILLAKLKITLKLSLITVKENVSLSFLVKGVFLLSCVYFALPRGARLTINSAGLWEITGGRLKIYSSMK